MKLEFVAHLVGGFRLYLNDEDNYVLVNENTRTAIGISDYGSLVTKKDGHIITDGGGKLGIADLYGNILVPCEYDIFCSPPENEGEIAPIFDDTGYVRAGTDGRFCFFTNEGEKICEAIYDVARSFCEGFAAVMRDEKWTFIDENGNELFPPKYDDVEEFESISNGEAVAIVYLETEKGRFQAAINKSGEEIIPLDHQAIFFLGSDDDYRFIVVRDMKQKTTIRKFNGELFSSLTFDKVLYDVDNETVVACKNGKIGVVGSDDKIIVPFEYDKLFYDRHYDVYQSKKENLWGLIRKDGKVLKDCVYTSMLDIRDGKMQVSKSSKKSGKYFYLTVEGKEEH